MSRIIYNGTTYGANPTGIMSVGKGGTGSGTVAGARANLSVPDLETIAAPENGTSFSAIHNAGEYIYHNGKLYKMLLTVNVGDPFTEHTNIEEVVLADEVSQLNQSLSDMFITDVFDCPAFTVTGSKSTGEYTTEVYVAVSKTGYTPIAVTALAITHPASYHANAYFNSQYTRVYFDIYKAILASADVSIAAGDMKAYVLYKKNT